MNAKVIALKDYLPQAPQYDADTYAYARERREQARFRARELRAWITCVVENLVMLAVAGCTIFSVLLALTML